MRIILPSLSLEREGEADAVHSLGQVGWGRGGIPKPSGNFFRGESVVGRFGKTVLLLSSLLPGKARGPIRPAREGNIAMMAPVEEKKAVSLIPR